MDGDAQYLGHLSVGDEVLIRPELLSKNSSLGIFYDFVKEKLQAIDAAGCCWQVDGFPEHTRLRLRPRYLSQEGLTSLEEGGVQVPKVVTDVCTKGDRSTVSVFSNYSPTVIRRNAFGEVRWRSKSGLPVSWRWVEDSHVVQ